MSWVTQKAQQKENREEEDSDRDSEDDRGRFQTASARRHSPPSPSREKGTADAAESRGWTSSEQPSRRIELQRRKEQRQHNVENLLNQITERSNEIVSEVMSWKAGAEEHAPERRDEMLRLARKREWLRSQLQFYQSYLEADMSPITIDETMTEDQATQREFELYKEIQQLKEKAFEANNNLLQQQLLLRRVLEQPVLYKVVFPDGTTEDTPLDELLRKLFIQRDAKVQALLEVYEAVSAVQESRFNVQQQIRNLTIQNRAKWKEYKQKKHIWESQSQTNAPPSSVSAETDPVIRKLETDIAKDWKNNLILRRATQAIILSSGINWAADRSIRDFLLTLEEPPNIAPQSDEVDPEEAREEEILREVEKEMEQEDLARQQQQQNSRSSSIKKSGVIKKPQPNGVAAPQPSPPNRGSRGKSAFSSDAYDEDAMDVDEEVFEQREPVSEEDGGEYRDSLAAARRSSTGGSRSSSARKSGGSSSSRKRNRGRPVEDLGDPLILRFRELLPSWTRKAHKIRQARVSAARKALSAAGFHLQRETDPQTIPKELLLTPLELASKEAYAQEEEEEEEDDMPASPTRLEQPEMVPVAAPVAPVAVVASSSSSTHQQEQHPQQPTAFTGNTVQEENHYTNQLQVEPHPAAQQPTRPPLLTPYDELNLPHHDDDLREMDVDDLDVDDLV